MEDGVEGVERRGRRVKIGCKRGRKGVYRRWTKEARGVERA